MYVCMYVCVYVCVYVCTMETIHRRKMSDWSTRDHVILPNSKWRQYLHRLFIVERVANAYTEFLSIAWTFYYPFSPIPMGFVPCDARVLAVLPDSTLDLFKRSLFTITKDNNISEKSRVTRKNGLRSQLNAAEK